MLQEMKTSRLGDPQSQASLRCSRGDLEQEAGGRVAGGGPTRRERPGHWQGPTPA